MDQDKKTLVLGASPNPARYSYLAITKLKSLGHDVVAVGRRSGNVAGVEISREKIEGPVDTVTLYLNPTNQEPYIDYLLNLKPRRIIFNPGTENPRLMKLASDNDIEPVVACTLVMLSTRQY